MSEILAHRTPAPILDIANVSKVFSLHGRPIHALKDVNLQIQKGEFVCLIGASGCGKSTLLRIMGGFESVSTGVARMYHTPISEPGPDRGMVFQDYGLFPWLTVRQNIAFGPKQRGLPEAKLREIADHYLHMVGLSKFADHFPHQLSGGMKQRVSIARALANDCEVLLMDEPFGALDALTREVLQQELLDIWAKTRLTVIFVTHAVEEAVLLADRVVVMTAGPGRVERDYRIPLERPRHITTPEFNRVRQELTELLSSHVAHHAKAA
ncbi:ABC transporter ATP-binding protein [Comamonas aquatica]|uniref:ABC transporter ATP-binding protein n=1 Tax=Comamonas aquatica TaxID=225991 RepID=UPI0005A830BA|nr:ABC transporter ATP-binding protein [Comamonas aquatica]ANY61055.1 sulfonate ABC transporter ATP-binding protein [Comamonas aquatica]MDH0201137.1 ABC transporter ATP-binding protein [Comamonas aquatica]MDH0382032.1 ABC transporter ATP-binding protein [Comamonas aquatica]MDH0430188.1 ABC transporter ATP-binding protein [Comamonas aquatica]MDH0495275.1 ABC transporter ATP-binding protein [Comamonas aquatica]